MSIEPGEDQTDACIGERRLPHSDISFPGLVNTYAYPAGAMKAGDGVFLATLIGDQARFFAVGLVVVKGTGTDPAVINWTATQFGRFPNERGGLPEWRSKTAFEISKEPAKRYELLSLLEYYVKTPI